MHVFIIGITGGVGSLVAQDLLKRGDTVAGLVRRPEQRDELAAAGMTGEVGDLTALSSTELVPLIGQADCVVFTAGAAGSQQATSALDGEGVVKAIEAAQLMPTPPRFVLVSVFPEAWRERNLGPDFDHYIHVKKTADIALVRSELDWVILRPSALQDEPGRGTVSLGPAEIHEEVPRADVAATLAALVHEPGISRQILELTAGSTPINEAVIRNVPKR
ncbi:NAD(P)H-binding protein [Aeromicrobium chenweiae]|uniref:NAD-dependent dehydratase n=1 Tax=Aeromicrobium chenweiae TaxID=2079793 RepID=A0A2S0WKN4_9ACTN|nr:NAD(P)H-binding protein [Aeromicrobium chenweiae]AWB91906.1 NAD-dependent dehydratase [Aeromicrobium chenweiae]TGN32755.1 NAD-dependent epimerase/dehydratase family protein [Aeromicrobium chenweiae]